MMGGILLYPAMLRLLLWPPVPGRDGAGSGRAARRYHFSMRGPDVLGVQGNFPDADYFTATLRDFLVASRQQHIEMRILFFPVKFLHQRFSWDLFCGNCLFAARRHRSRDRAPITNTNHERMRSSSLRKARSSCVTNSGRSRLEVWLAPGTSMYRQPMHCAISKDSDGGRTWSCSPHITSVESASSS